MNNHDKMHDLLADKMVVDMSENRDPLVDWVWTKYSDGTCEALIKRGPLPEVLTNQTMGGNTWSTPPYTYLTPPIEILNPYRCVKMIDHANIRGWTAETSPTTWKFCTGYNNSVTRLTVIEKTEGTWK